LTPIEVGDTPVIPRDVFHALLEPKVSFPQDEDLVVLRVLCSGENAAGLQVEAKIEVIDYYDRQTGFRAMERMTGFPAAIVAHMMASGRTPRGAVPLELSVDGGAFVAEWRRRDLPLSEGLA
jgi:lysine 6-dehydrogenase